jgi:hypothetical protein
LAIAACLLVFDLLELRYFPTQGFLSLISDYHLRHWAYIVYLPRITALPQIQRPRRKHVTIKYQKQRQKAKNKILDSRRRELRFPATHQPHTRCNHNDSVKDALKISKPTLLELLVKAYNDSVQDARKSCDDSALSCGLVDCVRASYHWTMDPWMI